MKTANNLIYYLMAILVFTSCQEEQIPKANFELNTIKVFDGTIAHEKVNLTWAKPESNNPPLNYVLEYTPDGKKITVDPTATEYEIKGIKNNVTYEFSIQANYGEFGISGKNKVKLKPADELNFSVLPGNGFAIAIWETPNRDDIAKYKISWTPNNSVKVQPDVNSYKIEGLTNDTEYEFKLEIMYSDQTSSNPVSTKATPGNINAFITDIVSPMKSEVVQFTYNAAFLPQSTAVSWNWNFGDGNSSTDQNPTHTYSKIGVYDVTLQIEDAKGFTYSGTKKIYVWGEKWAFDIGFQIKPQSPAIGSDGTIYIGSEDNNNFHAINQDGTLKWTYTGLTDNVYSSASIASDGTIYVASKDDYLHAINPNGTQKWKFSIGSNAIYTTPSIATDGTVYIGSDSDNLFAVNPDGTQKWVFNTAGFNIRSTPAIAQDGTVYITSDNGNLYALNPANGSELWSFNLGGKAQSGMAIDTDGTVIVSVDLGGSSGAVFAVKPDGTKKWSANITGRITVCSPAIANETVYVGTKEGNNLLALNASNGSQKWSFKTPGAIVNSSPAIDKNGMIYFGSWDNNVYALNPDGTLKYKFLTGGNVWSSPAIGNDGTIYIGSYDKKLYAIEMYAEGISDSTWPMFGKNSKHTSR